MPRPPAALSTGEAAFVVAWRALNGPPFVSEFRFDEARRWRFDFAWPAAMVAVEIEGGTRGKSRHTSGAGYQADCEKYNSAALMGWAVIRLTPAMIDVPTLQQIDRYIRSR